MHPITVTVDELGQRSRLTVFFRLLLAVPHILWAILWTIAVMTLALPAWIITLGGRTLPDPLHGFFAAYTRYLTHLNAYLSLLANPYPPFTGPAAGYPVDVVIAAPAPQNRWKTGFRLILAIPAIMLGTTLATGGISVGGATSYTSSVSVLAIVSFLGWWASLFTARMPSGMENAGLLGLQYGAQLGGYLLFLTDRYPDADPAGVAQVADRRADPTDDVTVVAADDDLRRSRLTVFFRLLLALPHLIWLVLWGVVAVLAGIVMWLVALVRTRPPEPLRRFLAAYVRYSTHVQAYLLLAANPFPGFTGTPGSYPVDVQIAPTRPQRRLTVLGRLILVFPAVLLAGAISGAAYTAAFLGWWVALFTGRLPKQFRALVVWALHYSAQLYAYIYIITGRYPYSAPFRS